MPHFHTSIFNLADHGLRTIAVVGGLATATLTAGVVATTTGGSSPATGAPVPAASAPSTAPAPTRAMPATVEPAAPPDTMPQPSASSPNAAQDPIGAQEQPIAVADQLAGEGPTAAGPQSATGDDDDELVSDGPEGVMQPGAVGNDWSDDSDSQSTGPVPLDPTVPHPCEQLGDGEQRFVIAAAVELDSGEFVGELPIVNCSDQALDIELAASNGVTFESDDTTVAPGESMLAFEIDDDAVDVGAFELKLKVTQVGCCADYADVYGFKQGFDPDIALDLGLTAGAGEGGCKAGCIATAWISGSPLNTAVELTVTTRVPADIAAYVSTQPPVQNQAGDPWMPGVEPALSATSTDRLHGTIAGLDPSTTYHIVIRAVDDNGVSTYADSFTTVAPVEHPTGYAGNDPEPGCSAGCITHAVIDGATHDAARLSMHTSMPARLEAWVGTSPVDHSGIAPTLPNPIAHYATPEPWTTWKLDIGGLEGETTYYVVLRATDANGKRDHQVGSFTTPRAPDVPVVISVDRIDIRENGDLIGRGEIRFGFGYDGDLIGQRTEEKLKDGATIWLDAYNFVVTQLGPDEATRGLAIWGGERDASLAGFCEAPLVGLDCHGINWGFAHTGTLTLADITQLPACEHYGFEGHAADDFCQVVTAEPGIGDSPTFDAVVRYDLD